MSDTSSRRGAGEAPTEAAPGDGRAERATLEAQRDQWLRSLDQLDAELEAGDLSQDDHRRLNERYSAQLAAVLRRLDGDVPPAAGTPPPPAGSWRSRGVARLGTVLALSAFALGAGFLLAQTSGERGVNDQLSGAIDASSRTRVAECQELGSIEGNLVGALSCFDELLLNDPENAEALSYRGWYLLLAAGSLQAAADSEADDQDADELIATGLTYLDRAIAADPLLPDPLAFRATVYDRQGRSGEACADVATLVALDPPSFFLDQTAAIAERNDC